MAKTRPRTFRRRGGEVPAVPQIVEVSESEFIQIILGYKRQLLEKANGLEQMLAEIESHLGRMEAIQSLAREYAEQNLIVRYTIDRETGEPGVESMGKKPLGFLVTDTR